MAVSYHVTVLRLGTLVVDHGTLVAGRSPDTLFDIPVWGVAVEGDGRRFLFDTGFRDPEWVRRTVGPASVSQLESFDTALDAIGWRPGDIDVVLNSHLHFDHCGNNARMTAARFLISEREWEFAHEPSPAQRHIYNGDWMLPPLSRAQIELVINDFHDLADGLRIIQTPGHTPGHQSLLVRTAEGMLCLTGDAANIRENFRTGVPGGVHTSAAQARASLEKIRALADRVVMIHDPDLEHGQDTHFPDLATTLRRTTDCAAFHGGA